MRSHGVRFQNSLSGTLHLARTNAFFMGGGKALVNAYYRSAAALGIQVRYDTPVAAIERDGERFVAAILEDGPHRGRQLRTGGRRLRVQPRVARPGWGTNENGERPAEAAHEKRDVTWFVPEVTVGDNRLNTQI